MCLNKSVFSWSYSRGPIWNASHHIKSMRKGQFYWVDPSCSLWFLCYIQRFHSMKLWYCVPSHYSALDATKSYYEKNDWMYFQLCPSHTTHTYGFRYVASASTANTRDPDVYFTIIPSIKVMPSFHFKFTNAAQPFLGSVEGSLSAMWRFPFSNASVWLDFQFPWITNLYTVNNVVTLWWIESRKSHRFIYTDIYYQTVTDIYFWNALSLCDYFSSFEAKQGFMFSLSVGTQLILDILCS